MSATLNSILLRRATSFGLFMDISNNAPTWSVDANGTINAVSDLFTATAAGLATITAVPAVGATGVAFARF